MWNLFRLKYYALHSEYCNLSTVKRWEDEMMIQKFFLRYNSVENVFCNLLLLCCFLVNNIGNLLLLLFVLLMFYVTYLFTVYSE